MTSEAALPETPRERSGNRKESSIALITNALLSMQRHATVGKE